MEPAFAVSSVGEAGLHGLRQQTDVAGRGVVEVAYPPVQLEREVVIKP